MSGIRPKLRQDKALPVRLRWTQAGQHTLEYTLIMILVIAGIILGGPYVIRSWNAQMKGWEDSVMDSFTDPLVEAPPDVGMLPGCAPQLWQDAGCGGSDIDSLGYPISCTPRQMLQTRVYYPPGCEDTIYPFPQPNTVRCVTSDCCCDAPQSTGFCGVQDSTLTNQLLSCAGTVFDYQPVDADGTCPDGYMKSYTLCGDDVDPGERRYGCMDDPTCIFNCSGSPTPNTSPEYGSVCSGDLIELTGNTTYTYVNPGACTPAKCEVQCRLTFQSYGTYCACPAGQWAQCPFSCSLSSPPYCTCDQICVPIW